MIETAPPTMVADASAVVALLAENNGAGTWAALQFASAVVAAPDLMPYEVANTLRRKAREGRMSDPQARAALQALAGLPVEAFAFRRLAGRAWELRANLTFYDAAYVALAELLDAPLVTLDARIAGAPGLRCEVRAYPG